VPRVSDEHRSARRAGILEAARGLFEVNGFHATSMDDIIAAAGMSAGGVYRYFPGKEAIIMAIAEEVVDGLTAAVTALLGEDDVPPLGEVLRQLVVRVDAIADGPGRLALVVWGEAQRDPQMARVAENAGSRMRSAVLELVRRAHSAGQLPAEADPTSLGKVVFSMVGGYLLQRRIIGDVDPQRYADAMVTLLRS
jgi:AcrR family transcriptional regulator